ncbi:hypothetical protein EXIGLDRAFT_827800 [Exidia glandulosa HHB12029]|uniref:INO80 complex subunit F domain-containing protein n=1 Tax=Exidia glandulosa HHB12029 TaxID=1314781 RepID=A0A165QN66_EXIGL|nr:hypothetical protein EXIGLDRAFT_827800 [Exidia glandulosa HHB12029]
MSSSHHQLDQPHHSPSRQHAHTQTTDEARYQQKYRDLKKKENEKLLMQVMQTKHNIQRLRLERSILYEKLGSDQHRHHHPQASSRSAQPHAHHHHHHHHTPQPQPAPYQSAALPPYPTSSSASSRHHHSSRHHAPPPQQYAPQHVPYAGEPSRPKLHTHDTQRSTSAGASSRSPVHAAPRTDDRHLVPIQSVRDAGQHEPSPREYYEERDRDRDRDRERAPADPEWRRRESIDDLSDILPSVAAVLRGSNEPRKRKRSESRDPERDHREPSAAPMSVDDA